MTDTPPDRKEEAGAPDGPRNPWVSWLVWLILLPVLYVLSIGPANWLGRKGYIPDALFAVYDLLDYLPDSVQELIRRYMGWW